MRIAASLLIMPTLGTNTKTGDLLRCPAAVIILVPTMLGAQKAEVFSEKADLRRRQPS